VITHYLLSLGTGRMDIATAHDPWHVVLQDLTPFF